MTGLGGLDLGARISIGIALAAALAYATTPVAIATARRWGFLDRPAGYKGHLAPTPYLGGTAVILAFALAVLVGDGQASRTLPLLAGVTVLLVVGTIDDRRQLSPLLRVAVELSVGALLSAAGLGWKLGAGAAVDASVTAVWVAAVVNAFNLFDNMDGAASTMAIVSTAGTCVLASFSGNAWAAAGSAALCGACLGFLPHNLARPARIFLGDGGSMPIGFAVAALAASAARAAEPTLLALLTGVLLVGVPAMDSCLVVVSRRRRHISILTGGQDHLTHRTRGRMRTARRVALVLGSAQAVISGLVIVATQTGSVTVVYVLLGFVICAAAVIIGLEDRLSPTTDQTGAVPATGAPDVAPVADAPHAVRAHRSSGTRGLSGIIRPALLVTFGLGAGASALFSAYYSPSVWLPLGLVLMVLGAAAAIVRPPRVTLPIGLSLAGIAGLGLWSLLSTSWAQGVEQATVDSNLWLAYAAVLLLLLVLLRGRRHAELLLAACGVGIVIVAASVLVRMLGANPAGMFLVGRLNAPLGYINGEGCLFAMGCWLCLAVAERDEPWAAGAGVAGTVAMASLALLSESRGAAIASFAAVVVTLAVVPGIRRRTMALVVVAGGVAAAAGPTIRIYSVHATGIPAGVVHHAATAILLSAAVSGLVWATVTAIVTRLRAARSGPGWERLATVLTVLVLVTPVVAALVRLPSLQRTARSQWHAFVNLSTSGVTPTGQQSRLLSGGGNRYDYWRVAWDVFTAHPLGGVGAGNYTASYYLQRRTEESIQNPHSLELQTLSELGVIGAVLLLMLVVGVMVGARRLRAQARSSPRERALMLAATGCAIVWLVDTSGDWMHLVPGVTAIALAAAAVLCRGGDRGPDPVRRPGTHMTPASLGGAALVTFVLVVGGASLLRSEIVDHDVSSAHSALGHNPAATISDARDALQLDSADLDAYYLEAAGQARFDRAATARSTLLAAVHEDPQQFVTWTLLGDLEVRLGRFRAAKAYYGHASRLDPRDPYIAELASDPRAALTSNSGE